MQICILIRLSITAMLELLELGSYHCALRLIKMSPSQIERDHVRERVVARVDREVRLDTGLQAGAVAMAAVKDHVLEQDDALAQAVHLDVGDERLELGAFHQREDVGERVKLEIGAHCA